MTPIQLPDQSALSRAFRWAAALAAVATVLHLAGINLLHAVNVPTRSDVTEIHEDVEDLKNLMRARDSVLAVEHAADEEADAQLDRALIIGVDCLMRTPMGERPVDYCDWSTPESSVGR